ncbi:TPA: type II toxin-antitoxin system RelE/ParE family toxin [Escherichia coli]|uniref:type II toxin-antitoxin system RelE/ParE family toxin n=1 Tax=Escherichia coli TaxID=562 RepID=UPI000BDEF178|nr:type II toxin-antitoxin system RelE/ParE family toxin [Escherichia coli]EER0916712.1 toxin [Escherichia coli O168:H8]EES8553801.1 toxin [Escherichia coli O168]HBC3064673.1 type II toxin-antitoxin system RelE/ParE family toxin [Escherichia coli O146]EER0947482.1 toxin [Escherichia coli O168:H8]EER2485479.1 toxin [Escherichia coli]
MIGSFKDGPGGELARFYFTGVRGPGIPNQIEKALRRKLSLLDAASCETSLFVPPGNNYERLRGNLNGWSSIRVSLQWRLIFQWRDGYAYDVYLDPHTYR